MTTATYPSSEFPGYPGIAIDVPEGWSAVRVPGAQLVVTKEVPEGDFRPSITVTVSRLEEGVTLADVAKAAAASLEARPGYAEVGRSQREISGRPGFVIEGSWVSDAAGTLAQDVRATVVEHDRVADLVEITGTCGGTQIDTVWAELKAAIDGIRVTDAPAAGTGAAR